MNSREIFLNFFLGKHNIGQIFNLLKYVLGSKKEIVNWDPIYISAFPTTKCNLHCDMCLSHSTKFKNSWGQKKSKDMDFKLFKEILNRYRNALVVSIIGNGEALLNKDFFKMVDYASKMKMYSYSGSNGILISDYAYEILNSPLHTYIISLNGHNSSEFNRMTGMPEHLFNKICNNTVNFIKKRNMMNSKLKVMVSIILDKYNYQKIQEMIKFVNNLGADGVYFFQFLPTPTTGFTPERCLFHDNKKVTRIFNEVKLLNRKTNLQIILPPLLSDKDINKACNVPFYNLAVDGDGNVGGCSCQLLNFSENGKFWDEDDPWNNQYFYKFRKMFLEPEQKLYWPCKWCYNNTQNSSSLSSPGSLSLFLRKQFKKLKYI